MIGSGSGSGGAAGGGVNITINGSVLSDKDEIARVVGDAVMTNARGTGVRFPSGA
jgi:hypothetical protein